MSNIIMTTDAEAEREAPRLFIRTIGRISDATDNAAFSKRFDGAFCNPDIAESLTMYVPVATVDTYGATKGVIRQKISMFLQDERANSAPVGEAGAWRGWRSLPREGMGLSHQIFLQTAPRYRADRSWGCTLQ